MPPVLQLKPCSHLSTSDKATPQLLIGIDEAGRGPLAGPVVAGAVALDDSTTISDLTDSKKLNAATRDRLFDEITSTAIAYGIGVASPNEIDSMNILQATLLAMRRAFEDANVTPNEVWVDGNQDPGLPVPTFTLVQGDAKMAAISAASIVAKVTRDRIMFDYAEQYPEYGFERHKGYPTATHLSLLEELGPSPIHRQSFAPVRELGSRLF